MKRILLSLGIAFALLLTTVSPAKAEEGWNIDSFDSQITVEEAGTVSISETIAVDFANLSKHGIYRDIPVTYTNADGSYLYTKVEVQSLLQDGDTGTYTSTAYNGYLQLKIGDANRTISGKHTYTITYRATGILKAFENFDELYWNVTGSNWEVPISRASATITLPKTGTVQASCYYGSPGATAQCTSNTTGSTASFDHASTLQPGEGMTVALGYTSGMVPLLTVDSDQSSGTEFGQKVSSVPAALGFFGVLIAGFVILLQQFRKHGRDALVNGRRSSVVAPEYEPPFGLRPAEVGCVIDEKADTLDISAAIVDLAVRGFLTITEIPKQGWFGSTDYQLAKLAKPTDELREYESQLFNALFADGETVLISSLTNSFYTHLANIKETLYAEVTKMELFRENPNKVRARWFGIGITICFVGGFLVFASVASIVVFPAIFAAFLIGAGFALGILGFPVMLLATFMPSRTEKGREAFEKIKGYKMFLSATEKYRQPYFESQNFFMDVLPYAMVFGVTAKLASSFAAMGIVPAAPVWYTGSGPFNPTVFGDNLTIFSKSLNSAMASSPRSSGSGGGGFSGGGFGGGGGGSW